MLQLLQYQGRIPKPQPLLTPDPEPDHFLAPLRYVTTKHHDDQVDQSGDEPDSSDDDYTDHEDEHDGTAGGSGTGSTHPQYTSSRNRTSGPFKARKKPQAQPAAAGATAAGGSKAVGPDLVLEQAAGLACMLCHNADNHFNLVNLGIVPMLVALLQQGTLTEFLGWGAIGVRCL